MKATVAKYFRIYKAIIKISILADLEYRINLISNAFSSGLWVVLSWIFIEIIFVQVNDIAGYSKFEVILIYAIARITKKTFGVFIFDNVKNLPQYVNKGDLDYILTKPVKPIFFISVYHTLLTEFIDVLSGVLLLIYAVNHLSIEVSVFKLLAIIFVSLLMGITFFSIILSFLTLSFKYGDITHGYWIYDELSGLNRLPFESLKSLNKLIFGHLFPVVLFGAVPVAILLNRFDYFNLVYFLIAAVIWAGFASQTWKWGLQSYTSAGG